jgi:anti-sigma factor RsiW
MLKFWRKRNHLGSIDQPDDVELLSYLDGQLPPERHAEIEKLKEESWEIRLRLAELKRDIETYTEATRHLVPDQVPPFAEFWKGFPAEPPSLDQAERSSASPASRKLGSKDNWSSFSRRIRWLWPMPLPSARLTAALVVLFVGVIAFVIRISLAPSVSAKELIRRTIQAEEQRIHVVTAPVIYQKLRVHRKLQISGHEDSATWEIWNDANHGRFRQRVEDTSGAHFVPLQGDTSAVQATSSVRSAATPTAPGRKVKTNLLENSKETNSELKALPPVLSDITWIYKTNRMDQRRPLSPEAFEAWQSHVQKRTDRVAEAETADGLKAFVLSTEPSGPFATNAIVRGELVVRASDWHPVEQRLRVQGTEGVQDYQVTESSFQVLALNTLDPGIFANFIPPPPVVASISVPAPSTLESPTPTDLLAAEVEAHYALHRFKACLGESIEVVPIPNSRIEVRGLAASAEQKEELLEELRRVPFVSLSIQTIEEATKAGSLSASHTSQGKVDAIGESPSGPTITVQPPRLPIQDELERYFAKSDSSAPADRISNISSKIAELSTGAVSLSRTALSHAWALRRLAEGFGPARTGPLRRQSRWLLEAMVRDHLHEVHTYLGRSQGLLGPILSSCPGGSPPSVSSKPVESPGQSTVRSPDWVNQTLLLFHNVEQMDSLTNGLFAGAGLPADNPQLAVQGLLSIYGSMASQCESLEREVAKEFSSTPNQLSSQARSD